jgi:hypothetical protein
MEYQYQNINPIPLHTRTHFRRLREVIHKLCAEESIPSRFYNLKNIRCYETHGHCLKGTNVVFKDNFGKTYKDSAPFLQGSAYDVYEIPNDRNKEGSPYGSFLFLIHCLSWPYWFFGKLDVNSHSTTWILYGKYDISMTNHISVKKTESAKAVYDMQISYNINDHKFDPLCIRTNAYMKFHSREDVVNVVKKRTDINSEKVKNKNKAVEIFKKNNKVPNKKRNKKS